MNSDPVRTGSVRSMVTFDDLVADLVWPKLLRAGALAMHPGRLLIALVVLGGSSAILAILLSLESALGWSGSPESQQHLSYLLSELTLPSWESALGGALADTMIAIFFIVPLQFVRVHPLATLAGVPICLSFVAIGFGAISRMAATELATGRSEPLLQAFDFARGRWSSLVGALSGPILLVWFIGVSLAVAGFFLARWPGVNLVGAILYGLALAAGLFATFIMLVYVLAAPLLPAGVCCDGADALDAIQRAYAYVLARPLRLVCYLGLLVVEGAVLFAVVVLLFAAVITFTAHATGKWADESGRRMVFGEKTPAPMIQSDGTPAERTWRDRAFDTGASIVGAWDAIPRTIPLAFLFSYAACGSTILYLGMRRVCDGQDMNELWSPNEDRPSPLGAGAAPTVADEVEGE